MKLITVSRRQFLTAFTASGWWQATRLRVAETRGFQATVNATEQPTIRGRLRLSDSLWCFDPVGLYIKPGERVRFANASIQMITVTAYHPQNENHELRIPEAARPFNFGYPEQPFYDWTFDAEGTYDFFSRYQEVLGMIGRIVVGRPGGPGEKPWGYGGKEGRNPVYEAVLKTAKLLDSQEIVKRKVIPCPFDDMIPRYPMWD